MTETKRSGMKDTVLRKLRRGSKDSNLYTPSLSLSRHTTINSTHPVQPIHPNRLTFFDLPPELRNTIYDLVVHLTPLVLTDSTASPSKSSSSKTDPPPPPPLLITSKATRHEFLPYLLSTARVTAYVKDFDLRALTRAVQSLYATELKALRTNSNLRIALQTRNCSRADLARLRRWLALRADSLDRLPWRYEVVCVIPELEVARERMLHELGYYRRALTNFGAALEGDGLRGELEAVIRAFGEKEEIVREGIRDEVLERRMSGMRLIRGLSGGGLR